ncbi:hypothetical protein WICMUC_002143 [Wickerhamomyces mucosus]|uniref:Uncharacterized protein n=1 Tax=Wickerhamomyces mucosus TaxID=1378264 RepID=A0A9P8TFB2_9ASCO|nr:hypothetical protein WICMUC_002143 [Wickerhamomyces mucosus]
MKNDGILTAMKPNVKTVLIVEAKRPANTFGNLSSILFISLENLFMILPIGVVSKYDIGALRTDFAILLCNTVELLMAQKTHINMVLPNVKKPEPRPKKE